MAAKKIDKMALAAAALSYALETGNAQHSVAAQALYVSALNGKPRPEVILGAIKQS